MHGDGGNTHTHKKERNWEIRPRKKSVGPSDDGMDVDSDETEDEEEEKEEDGKADEDEDADGDNEGGGVEEEVEMDEDDEEGVMAKVMYGGWSEDEESSFDAELFFAGLTDSDSGDAAMQDGADEDDDDETVDEDEDNVLDLEAMALAAREAISFDVVEGWDGSMVFTNNFQDGQGLLDWDFEVNAAQLVEQTTSDADGEDSDVEMSDADRFGGASDSDGLAEVLTEGESTDEELVDGRGLPTPRAMKLFRPIGTPSAIDPKSTVSPNPNGTYHHPRLSLSGIGSPKPADILTGRVYYDTDEEEEEHDRDFTFSPPASVIANLTLSSGDGQSVVSVRRGPVMGTFAASKGDELRRAVIDGSSKNEDMPSPFPRTRRTRRLSESWSGSNFTGVSATRFLCILLLIIIIIIIEHRLATGHYPSPPFHKLNRKPNPPHLHSVLLFPSPRPLPPKVQPRCSPPLRIPHPLYTLQCS